jgi:hypothetical protein
VITSSVKITMTSLTAYKKVVNTQLKSGSPGVLTDVFKQWAIRYRSFIQQRYNKYSRGGGDWAPLKQATIDAKGSSGILIDTGLMFSALTPVWQSPPGGINRFITGGVEVGFGGEAGRPDGLLTIAELAAIHQETRPIIVQPDNDTMEGCARDLERALNGPIQ